MLKTRSSRPGDKLSRKAFKEPVCDPRDIALKSFFLGPQAENAEWVSKSIETILARWFDWRRGLYPKDGKAISESDRRSGEFVARRAHCDEVLAELMHRFEDEVPKFSPRYLGHMFSEISLPALLGHIVALLHNPNNVSGEASRTGVMIEDEAIDMLRAMTGLPDGATGHFTSGGTIANYEALLRARERLLNTTGRSPAELKPVIFVPSSRHYSWDKGIWLIGGENMSLRTVALDAKGKLSVPDLRRQMERARVEGHTPFFVVSIAGSTELGTIDPVGEVQDLLDESVRSDASRIWHHVDAAYGGFFAALEEGDSLDPDSYRHLRAMARVDSITLDPHKLGYVPYSSGAFLCRDRRDYALKSINAPYVGFDLSRDRGPFTIEGSRSATGATATWLTGRSIGFGPNGYGRILSRTIQARLLLERKLGESGLAVETAPYLDILGFCAALPGEPLSATNARTLKIYHAFKPGEASGFYVSKTALHWSSYGAYLDRYVGRWNAKRDTDELVLVRMCLLNPFFASVEPDLNYPEAFVEALRSVLRDY